MFIPHDNSETLFFGGTAVRISQAMGMLNPEHDVENVAEVGDKTTAELVDSARDQYLLQRHGTLELIPKPTADPHDPLNWPAWKVSSRSQCRTQPRS